MFTIDIHKSCKAKVAIMKQIQIENTTNFQRRFVSYPVDRRIDPYSYHYDRDYGETRNQ